MVPDPHDNDLITHRGLVISLGQRGREEGEGKGKREGDEGEGEREEGAAPPRRP